MKKFNPDAIESSIQILVEGRTPQIFFREFIQEYLGITDSQIWDFGSISGFNGFLRNFSKRPGFQIVESLAIIRDAEENPAASAFSSICDSIQKAKLDAPGAMAQFSTGTPKIGVFIFPNCSDSGMIEDLCYEAISTDESRHCVDQFLACAKDAVGNSPKNLAKARLFSWLSTFDVSDPQLGRAAQKGLFDWESKAFNPLRDFCLQLKEDS